jgi:hypothetical protein
MHRPRDSEDLRVVHPYEQMLNAFAFSAKTCLAMWGPLGQRMIKSVDRWTEMQRSYLRQLQQT